MEGYTFTTSKYKIDGFAGGTTLHIENAAGEKIGTCDVPMWSDEARLQMYFHAWLYREGIVPEPPMTKKWDWNEKGEQVRIEVPFYLPDPDKEVF